MTLPENATKVLFVASEMATLAKTGGLADVVRDLSEVLPEQGIDCRVILPFYNQIPQEIREKAIPIRQTYVHFAGEDVYCGLRKLEHDGVICYFVDNEFYFFREGNIYGHNDDMKRFAFFSRAVVSLLQDLDGWSPDVINCHDWQTSLIPLYKHWFCGKLPEYSRVKTLFTIHNIAFQGEWGDPGILFSDLSLPQDVFDNGIIKMRDCINMLKAGIVMADKVNTVSENYANELGNDYFAKGLASVINEYRYKFFGILNGLGIDICNPTKLPKPFSHSDLANKAYYKKTLQEQLGLTVDSRRAVLGFVARLEDQKGCNLVLDRIHELLKADIQVVVLGTGKPHYEEQFRNIQGYGGQFVAHIGFDAKLADLIYAGADMFLMPSNDEPCGLAQMMSMKCGTVPIVRKTGGLADTVWEESDGTGRGFTFGNFDSEDMINAIYRALEVFYDQKEQWAKIMTNGMTADFSWDTSAKTYATVYNELIAD